MMGLGMRWIICVVFFVVVQFSDLGMAGEIQGKNGESQLIALESSSQFFMDKKFGVGPSPIPIQDFVRQPFPSPLTVEYFKNIQTYAQDQTAIPELRKLLRDGCKGKNIDERLCSNIVTVLGVLATPEALSGLREFLEQGSQESDLRVKTDAVRALGVWANIRDQMLNLNGQDTGGANDKESGELIKSVLGELVNQASEGLEKSDGSDSQTPRQSLTDGDGVAESVTPKSVAFSTKLLKDLPRDDQTIWLRRLRRAAIQGLAFSGSKGVLHLENGRKGPDVKSYLESLLAEAKVGTSFRAFMLEILSAHNIIARVGIECYFEQKKDQDTSDECKAKWVGNKSEKLQ
ncbi:HEAT repeat domain-containing protein [Candidatus Nitrospira neomarina]|uniref:HEAT repeat domain-containing protein n=1 Tax=Candidatus Nitrospira neomarina TaxID=3020899 RepID=A0AA96JUM5_9BACT|nr:HEAT repeat domain-containing protein [Candidatus Nitrospira neomarina]WNM60747.1 HEAT repeat domain-containing protein [Candidatus Nitrospira neomarina]